MKDNLDFEGMAGTGVNRAGNKYSGNQTGLKAKENYSNKTVKGTPAAYACDIGKSVTKDAFKTAPDTAKGGKINGGASVKSPSNPDKIYISK